MSNFRAGRIVVYDDKSSFQTGDNEKVLHVQLRLVDDIGAPQIDMQYDSGSRTIHARTARSSTDYRLVLTHLRQYLENHLANLQLRGAALPEEIRLHSNDYNNEVIKGNCNVEVLQEILMPSFASCNGVDWYIDQDAEFADVDQSIFGRLKSHHVAFMIGFAFGFIVIVTAFKVGQRYSVRDH